MLACWSRSIVVLLGIVALSSYTADACSCMPTHPQQRFCNADYVIVARVVKKHHTTNNQLIYKVLILQEYKMSDKARHFLKHGRLVSSGSDSMCGVQLQLGETYVIMGRGSPRLSMCDFYQPYRSLTIVMKRGIFGMYRKGCQCPIETNMHSNRISSDTCTWSFMNGTCESDYGICIRREDANTGRVSCQWRRNNFYKKCKASEKRMLN